MSSLLSKKAAGQHLREEADLPEKRENPHWRLSRRLKPWWRILPARHPVSARRFLTMKGGHEWWWKYVYDNDYDFVICPNHDKPGIQK
jgi:hypothetical protein